MEIENYKINIASLNSEKDQLELRHAEEISEIKEKCHSQIKDIETMNSEKLLQEYEKYTQLQEKLAKTQVDWEHLLAEEKANNQKLMMEMQEAYEAKLSRKDDETAEVFKISIFYT